MYCSAAERLVPAIHRRQQDFRGAILRHMGRIYVCNRPVEIMIALQQQGLSVEFCLQVVRLCDYLRTGNISVEIMGLASTYPPGTGNDPFVSDIC